MKIKIYLFSYELIFSCLIITKYRQVKKLARELNYGNRLTIVPILVYRGRKK